MGTGALLQGHAIVVQGTLLCYVMLWVRMRCCRRMLVVQGILWARCCRDMLVVQGTLLWVPVRCCRDLQGHASGTRYAVTFMGAGCAAAGAW